MVGSEAHAALQNVLKRHALRWQACHLAEVNEHINFGYRNDQGHSAEVNENINLGYSLDQGYSYFSGLGVSLVQSCSA